ncbi:acetate--CoA ligase family protein [Nocardioides sp. BGMRC 2183]|nr:acetate--CoA ligase family protein [Nocardioides sp. BGMRC 2183]
MSDWIPAHESRVAQVRTPAVPEAFLDPASVAVVGATEDDAKWGFWLASGALGGLARRQVWLGNRRADTVLGQPSHASVSDLPGVPELVVVCVPPAHVLGVVEEAIAAGTRAFLTITASVPDQDRLTEVLRASGARMIGPNSLGMYDADAELSLAWGTFTPGSLAIVSQSGQLGSEIAALAEHGGVGISRFYSVGNEIDVTAADLLESLVDHQGTRAVAVYLESFADGRRLVEVFRALRAAGKPVLLLATGASEASQRLAQSHTGSMTSSVDLVDAACRAGGALRVVSPEELVDLARYLTVSELPAGRRVAVVSDSGGQGGIAADLAAGLQLDTPFFSASLQQRLRALLPAGASVANPVDLAGAGEADLNVYAEVAEILAASGEVDAVLVSGYLGKYGEDTPSITDRELAVVDRLGALAQARHVPLVVHSMSRASRAVTRMWEHHVPAYLTVDEALRALAGAARLAEHPGREMKIPEGVPVPGGTTYWDARALLTEVGIAVPAAVRMAEGQQVADLCATATASLSYPVALKAAWLAHKSEHGGVVLGLRDEEQLQAALTTMIERLGPGDYVVEEMDRRGDVVEMIVGARRDRDFGPTIMVGYGGVEAELWRDVRLELAPVDREVARAMVDGLTSRRLLAGWRGRPGVDVDALVGAVVVASEVIAAAPHTDDLEINPVRVAPDGLVAVDALVLPSAPATGSHHAVRGRVQNER